jgi:hypothetical protein
MPLTGCVPPTADAGHFEKLNNKNEAKEKETRPILICGWTNLLAR